MTLNDQFVISNLFNKLIREHMCHEGYGKLFLALELDKYVNGLDKRQREVLELRFGINGKGQKSLVDTGRHFGVTRERVRQLEAKAIKELRDRISL